MRTIVALIVLAALGYFAQDNYHYRSALSEALIAAHQPDAVSACAQRGAEIAQRIPTHVWSEPKAVRLKIGNPDLEVFYWQTGHAMWRARYKDPHLIVMASGQPNYVLCEYDVVNAVASVRRL